MQNLNTIDFVKTLNTLRLQNKGKWYTWSGTVNNKTVQIKAYGTWLQLFFVDGLQCGNCADRIVKEFKNDLTSAVE
jgi:hypothetical protein